MKKSTPILATMILMVVLVAASVVVAAPAADPIAPAASAPSVDAPAAAPDKLVTAGNPGAYYLDYAPTSASLLGPTQTKGAMHFYYWSDLQTGTNSYNIGAVQAYANLRDGEGLEAAISLATYDGLYNGDIRAMPDFAIASANTTVVITEPQTKFLYYLGTKTEAGEPKFKNRENGDFDSGDSLWEKSGAATIVPATDPKGRTAAKLGGVDNGSGSVTHSAIKIPAMPPASAWPSGDNARMELEFVYYVDSVDATPNADTLTVELLDYPSQTVLATVAQISNTSGANGAWTNSGVFDLSGNANLFARKLQLRLRATTDGATPTTFYVDNVKLRVRHIVPKYWSTEYLALYDTFVKRLGSELMASASQPGNAKLDFVSMGVGLHGETQPADGFKYPGLNTEFTSNGLTYQIWYQTVNKITDMYADAFGGTGGTKPKMNLLLQFAPYFQNATERREFTNHAVTRYVGLTANNLMPEHDVAVTNTGVGIYDPMLTGGRYNFIPISFETYGIYSCTPAFVYWGLVNALDKHSDYVRFDPNLVRGSVVGALAAAKNSASFAWASNYWGQSVTDTPSVWTVMREHRNPTKYCYGEAYYTPDSISSGWPMLGNFNFYLTQKDDVPGGRTVPETNDPRVDSVQSGLAYAGLGNCSTKTYANIYAANYPCNKTPYNPNLPPIEVKAGGDPNDPYAWTGNGQEAWFVRRTDQPANPNMFFDVDDGYIDGSSVYTVRITVESFDIGTDKFSIVYDSPSGPKVASPIITKGNTKQLRRDEFVITDGRFANGVGGGRADFYIDSRGDGNEWIHLVDVARLSEQPQPTPTSTPSTGSVSGKAYHDANSNQVWDAGESLLQGAQLVLKQGAVEQYAVYSEASGQYLFPAVSPGVYTLSEKTAPPGYLLSPFTLLFQVGANQAFTFDVFHQPDPVVTPTPGKLFLPMILRPNP